MNPGDTGSTTNYIRPANFTVQVQHIFGPSVVNETKFGYNQSNRNSIRTGPSAEQFSVSGLHAAHRSQEIIEDGSTYSVLERRRRSCAAATTSRSAASSAAS